nr:respiratory nitrate reductase subunit gamma [Streptomyces colonosanans]
MPSGPGRGEPVARGDQRRPPLFQLHALTACLLFAAWPFTRLVHVWSVPIGYPARPYLVYRRRATTPVPRGMSTREPHSRRSV